MANYLVNFRLSAEGLRNEAFLPEIKNAIEEHLNIKLTAKGPRNRNTYGFKVENVDKIQLFYTLYKLANFRAYLSWIQYTSNIKEWNPIDKEYCYTPHTFKF